MLARASSDAGTRLRRSKSSSTVHRHPPPVLEPLDPETAHQHALAAATTAFSKIHAQELAERRARQSSELARTKSSASRKSHTSQGQGSHFPPRESSFRSMNQQKNGLGSRDKQRSRASTITTEKLPAFHNSISVDRPVSAPRPLSAQQSITLSDDGRLGSQTKFSRMSASSSITSQQIRKARSMYYASSVQTGSPIARPPTKYLTTPPVTATPPSELASNISSSQVVDSSPLVPPHPHAPVAIASEDVNKARDKYLESFHQRSMKQKPSMFLAPFRKRQSKFDNRKDSNGGKVMVPSATHQSPDDITMDFTPTEFIPQQEKRGKRSFSGSLKRKFKQVFRRASKEATHLPVQHIEASRDYFSAANSTKLEAQDAQSIPSPEEDILRQARSRTPSVDHRHAALLRSQSRGSSNGSACSSRSQRSLHSELVAAYPSNSRAASWETVASGVTLTQRAIKRLTVIHESKDSIGSEADRLASITTKRKSLPPTALAAFREPMQMERLLEDSSAPIDPKRVFSALMKEINSKSEDVTMDLTSRTPGAASDIFESSKTKELHANTRDVLRPSTADENRPPSRRAPSAATQSVQSKASSIRSIGRAIKSTIRTVTPSDRPSSPFSETLAQEDMNMLGSKDDFRAPHSTALPGAEQDLEHGDCENLAYNSTHCPSTKLIETRVEKAKERWKTPLDDVGKLQFPRETNRTYDIANFAQSMGMCTITQSSKKVAQSLVDPLSSLSPTPVKIPRLMSPMSPSVYSRNTDGISIVPNDSVLSLGSGETSSDTDSGSAVIVKSRSVRSYVVGTPSPRRPDSNRTSRDWRAWLSHEVSGIGSANQDDLKIDTHYLSPSHQRDQDTARAVHTDNITMATNLRDSIDMSTSGDKANMQAKIEPEDEQRPARHVSPDIRFEPAGVFEKTASHPDTFKEVSPAHTPPAADPDLIMQVSPKLEPTPGLPTCRVFSTSSRTSSSSNPSVESTGSARMNERFPYIETSRRSTSGRPRTSGHSRSPGNSVASSNRSAKVTPRSRIYSDLSAPTTDQTIIRRQSTNLIRSDFRNSKENVIPTSLPAGKMSDTSNATTMGSTNRTNSLHAMPSLAHNRSSSNLHVTPDHDNLKQAFTGAMMPPRANVRATLRPVLRTSGNSRPRSAFDLRAAHTAQAHIMSSPRQSGTIPGISKSPSALCKEPTPNQEGRLTDVIYGYDERGGSVSPGQRMANQFLKQRKSAGVLEGARYRAGLRLVREDTPAFL